jgi:hypothetical protein
MAQEAADQAQPSEKLEDVATGATEVEEADKDAENVYTSVLFPVYNEKKFPAGETVEVLLGFENKNEKDEFDVLFIQGYLAAPYDFSQRIHNFTGALYNTTVPKDTEASLLYRFKAEVGHIDPREYGFVIQIIYLNKDNTTFHAIAYNSTITITEANSPLDAKTVFTYITLVAILGLIGFGLYKLVLGKKGKYSRGSRQATTLAKGTDSKNIDWDYISPSHRAAVSKSPKSPSPKSPKLTSPKSPEKKTK